MAPGTAIVYGTLQTEASNTPMPSISLTLRFAEVRFEFRKYRYLGLLKGELFVAAHTAYLDLILNGCTAPESEWKFNASPEPTLPIQEKSTFRSRHDTSQERSAGASGDLSVSTATIRAGVAPSSALKTQKAQGAEFEMERSATSTHQLLVAIGNADAPSWRIESGLSDNYGAPAPLIGPVLNRARFCSISLNSDNATVELDLLVPSHGLSVRDENGLFRSVNKQKLARIRLQRHYCRAFKLHDLSFKEYFDGSE